MLAICTVKYTASSLTSYFIGSMIILAEPSYYGLILLNSGIIIHHCIISLMIGKHEIRWSREGQQINLETGVLLHVTDFECPLWGPLSSSLVLFS